MSSVQNVPAGNGHVQQADSIAATIAQVRIGLVLLADYLDHADRVSRGLEPLHEITLANEIRLARKPVAAAVAALPRLAKIARQVEKLRAGGER